MSNSAAESHRICLIDGFRVLQGRHVLRLPGPVERLLGLLAIRRTPVTRAQAAFTLWAESNEQHAAGSLRSALWSLRRSGHRLVAADGDTLQLAPGTRVDVHAALGAADRLIRGDDVALDDAVSQSLLGQLLPEWYEDWVIAERRRFDEIRVQALEALCIRHRGDGRLKLAVVAGRAAVDAEPLRESCRRALMLAHVADGNLVDALGQYLEFSHLIRTELGLTPSAQIEALVQSLRSPPVDAALTVA